MREFINCNSELQLRRWCVSDIISINRIPFLPHFPCSDDRGVFQSQYNHFSNMIRMVDTSYMGKQSMVNNDDRSGSSEVRGHMRAGMRNLN